MKHLVEMTALAAGLALASTAAQAVTVTAADLQPFVDGYTSSITANGVQFDAVGGNFSTKTVAGYLGIGVDGSPTLGEIDLNESVSASWAGSQALTSFSVAFLYNGPEFADVQETAKISLAGTQGIYGLLTAVSDTQATWQLFNASNVALGAASFISAVSVADETGAGVWTVVNPFANYVGTGVKFSAVQGACGVGDCFNPSDYALYSLTTAAIPEPGSYSMLAAGLAAVGGLMLRRRQRD